MTTRKLGIRALPLALIITLLAGMTSTARAEETGWRLRLSAISTNPGGDNDLDAFGNRVGVDFDSGLGIVGSADYRFSRRLGVELGIMAGAESDISFGTGTDAATIRSLESLAFGAITAGLNIDLTPERKAHVYVGPFVALVEYSDVDVELGLDLGPDFNFGFNGQQFDLSEPLFFPTTIKVETDTAIGVVLGVDLPLGERGWLFNGSVRYLETSIEGSAAGSDPGHVDFDPLIVGIGLGYRF